MSIIKDIITRLSYKTETEVLTNTTAIGIEITIEVVIIAGMVITIALVVQVGREMTASIITLATEGLKVLIGVETIVFATIIIKARIKSARKTEKKRLKKHENFPKKSMKISTFHNNFCNKKAIVNCMIS
jgi:hypothetical protein